MKEVEVTATVPATDTEVERTATIRVKYPESFEEAKRELGANAEEIVLSNALANWRITLQSNIRSGLRRGETPEQIAARLSGAKMGAAQSGARIDPVQAFIAKFAASTPEEQKKMLAELQARAAKK